MLEMRQIKLLILLLTSSVIYSQSKPSNLDSLNLIANQIQENIDSLQQELEKITTEIETVENQANQLELLELEKTGLETTMKRQAKLKSEPHAMSDNIKELAINTKIVILSYDNLFFEISVDGEIGWVHYAFVNHVDGIEVFKTKKESLKTKPKEEVVIKKENKGNSIKTVKAQSVNLDHCFDKDRFTKAIQLDKKSILFQGRNTFVALIDDNSCVDKGDIIRIILEDKTEIVKSNVNSFNCKGIAYYMLTDDEMETMRTSKISLICIACSNSSKCSILTSSQNNELYQTLNCLLGK